MRYNIEASSCYLCSAKELEIFINLKKEEKKEMATQVTKTYVKYVGEYKHMRARESAEEVSSRDANALNIPDWAISFNFFDQTTVTFDNGRAFESEPFNVGPTFTIPGPPLGSFENPRGV